MHTVKQLRIVIQAGGMYCLIHSMFSALTGVARFFAWRSTFSPFEMPHKVGAAVEAAPIITGLRLIDHHLPVDVVALLDVAG